MGDPSAWVGPAWLRHIRGRFRRVRVGGAEATVLAAMGYSLWLLAPQLEPIWRANDGVIHASLVRWVADRLAAGHLPLDGWYPYLALGSARFHHYQSLPHLLTGTLEYLVGRGRVFPWTTYLLLATWPASVFAGARLLGLERRAAAAAAVIAPLISSAPRMGIEWESYVWRGYGGWAQLWGMSLLPIVLGLTWQAVDAGRRRGWAAAGLGALIPMHLIASYLAILALPLWALVGPQRARRTARAVLIAVTALLAAAWFIVPVVLERGWMTRDLLASNAGYASIGMRRTLKFLFAGQLLDAGRTPILTVLALGGAVIAASRVRDDPSSRATLGLAALGLVLFAGRASLFGPVLDLLPGMRDVFMPRFLMGLHLAAIYLGGIGITWLLAWAVRPDRTRLRAPATAMAVLAIAVAITPAVLQQIRYLDTEQDMRAAQRAAEDEDRSDLAALAARVRSAGDGRTFAGLGTNVIRRFRIGWVPASTALLEEDVQVFGVTRPTWSILANVESGFSELDARQYPVFGVGYVLTPAGLTPEVPATLMEERPCCALWEVSGSPGYLRLAQSRRAVEADRATLLARARAYFRSPEFAQGTVWTIGYAGARPAAPILGPGDAPTPVEDLGTVVRQRVALEEGLVEATVEARATALLVLAATFDPGWSATVDGVEGEVQTVSPGMVGVRLEPGRHEVRIVWRSFPYYGYLALGLLAPLALSRMRVRVFADP